MSRSVRARLTLWYAASLAVVMAAYGAFVYAAVRGGLRADLDHALHEDEEVVREVVEGARDAKADWRAELANHWSEDEAYERRVRVRREDGAVLFQSDHPEDGAPFERMTHIAQLDGDKAYIEYGRSTREMEDQLATLLWVLLLGAPLGIGLAAAGGFLLARRALAPVGDMAERAATITASNLSERLPVATPDEFGRLATVFNATLARLDASFEQLRRFTADASHELRTPLTAIRTVGEVGLSEPRTPEQYREIVGSMLEEVDRLARLVDSLLTLSRADAGRIALQKEPLDLAALAREVAAHLGVLAEEKGQRIHVESGGFPVVQADRAIVRLAVVNLMDNAIKYAPPGSAVGVSVESTDGAVTLSVRDGGPGIPPEHQARVFDRFYRVDAARSRDAGGAGLGLAIARWAVESHGGRLGLVSEVGKGSTFSVVLPRGSPAQGDGS